MVDDEERRRRRWTVVAIAGDAFAGGGCHQRDGEDDEALDLIGDTSSSSPFFLPNLLRQQWIHLYLYV